MVLLDQLRWKASGVKVPSRRADRRLEHSSRFRRDRYPPSQMKVISTTQVVPSTVAPAAVDAASPRLRAWLFARNVWFRLVVLGMLVCTFLIVRHAKAVFWPNGGHPPRNLLDHAVQWGAIVWSLILPWAVADVVGWMIYRRHTPVTIETEKPELSRKMPYPVVFRIVTRGGSRWSATSLSRVCPSTRR